MLMQCLILITCVILGPLTSRATSQVLEVTSTSGVISQSRENNASIEWIFSPNKTYNALKLEFLPVNISLSLECRDAYLELLNGTKYCGETAVNLSSNCYIYNFASTYNESCTESCKNIQMNLTEPFIIKYYDSVGTSSFRLQYELYKCGIEQQTTTPMPSTSAVTTTESLRTNAPTISATSVAYITNLTTVIIVCGATVVIIGFGIALIISNRKRRSIKTHTVPPTMPRNDPRSQQTRPKNSIKRNRDVGYLTMEEINLPPSGIFGSPKARPKHTKAREGDGDYLLMEPAGPLGEVPKYKNLAFEGESSTGSNSALTTTPYYNNVAFTPSPNRAQDIRIHTSKPSKTVTNEKSQELSSDDKNHYVNREIRPKSKKTGLTSLELGNWKLETGKTGETSSASSQNSLYNSKSETTQIAVNAISTEPDKTGSNRPERQDCDNKDEQPKMTPITLELHQKRPDETGSTTLDQNTKSPHIESSQSKPETAVTDRLNKDTRGGDRDENAPSEDDPAGPYPPPRVSLSILQNVNNPVKGDEKLSSKNYLNAPPTPPPRDMDGDTPTGQDPGSPPLPPRNFLLRDDSDKNDSFEEDPDVPTLPSRDLLFGEEPTTNASSEKNLDAPTLSPSAPLPGVDRNESDSFEKDPNAPSLPTRDLLLGYDPNENATAEEDLDAPSLPPRDLLLEDGPHENGPVELEPDTPPLPPRIFPPGYRHANHPAYDMWG